MSEPRASFGRRNLGYIAALAAIIALWASYVAAQAAQPDDALAAFRNDGWWAHRPFLSTADGMGPIMGVLGHVAGTAIIGFFLSLVLVPLAEWLRPGAGKRKQVRWAAFGIALLAFFVAVRVVPAHVTEVYPDRLEIKQYRPWGAQSRHEVIEAAELGALGVRVVIKPRYQPTLQLMARRGSAWVLLGQRLCWSRPHTDCLDRAAPEVLALAAHLGRTTAAPSDQAAASDGLPQGSYEVVTPLRVWPLAP